MCDSDDQDMCNDGCKDILCLHHPEYDINKFEKFFEADSYSDLVIKLERLTEQLRRNAKKYYIIRTKPDKNGVVLFLEHNNSLILHHPQRNFPEDKEKFYFQSQEYAISFLLKHLGLSEICKREYEIWSVTDAGEYSRIGGFC